ESPRGDRAGIQPRVPRGIEAPRGVAGSVVHRGAGAGPATGAAGGVGAHGRVRRGVHAGVPAAAQRGRPGARAAEGTGRMKYAVDWADDALDTLATIWMHSADRQAVTAAQAAIDRLLAADPLGNGAPVSERLYALEVHPLRVLFEVGAGVPEVRVVSVAQ